MKSLEQDIKVILLNKIGKYGDDWVKIYMEPNNTYSDCGGRITVNIGDDYLGSYFFSHCGTKTFEQFIGKVGCDYLINKLFQSEADIDVESGNELFKSILRNGLLYRVKEARNEGSITKEKLRDLYRDLSEHEFRDIVELTHLIDSDSFKSMSLIFGDDWYYQCSFKKPNHVYARQKSAVQEVINYFNQGEKIA